MFNIIQAIVENLSTPSPIKTQRIPTHMPSSAMCNSAVDNKPIGTCLRASYFSRMEYPVSNPMGIYTKMTTEAGKLWESWVIDQYKNLGIYSSHSVKLYDPLTFISGEIDIVHYNPLTNEIELSEVKQYNGSNYYAAKELKGSKDSAPKPKDANLLQTFVYLLMCRNTNQNIKFINLVYIDRSCANIANNVQFRISLKELNNECYPHIEYFDYQDNLQEYTDFRITEKNLLAKNEALDQAVEKEEVPDKEYMYSYPANLINQLHLSKEISAIKFNKWVADPVKNNIGDWQCTFCKYSYNLQGVSTCESIV